MGVSQTALRLFFGTMVLCLAGGGALAQDTPAVTTIVVTGDPANNTDGATYSEAIGSPVSNQNNAVAFIALDSTDTLGIWSGVPGSLELAARQGTAAPGSESTFSDLLQPIINQDGEIAFLGVLDGIAPPFGIWAGVPGDISLVALTGDTAPGTSATFSDFQHLVLNDLGTIAFLATIEGSGVTAANNQGLWAQSAGGPLTLLMRTGQGLTINGNSFILDRLVVHDETVDGYANSDVIPVSLQDNDVVTVLGLLNDNSAGIFSVTVASTNAMAAAVGNLPSESLRGGSESLRRLAVKLLSRAAALEAKGKARQSDRILAVVLRRMDGCDGTAGEWPDRDDWIVDCAAQAQLQEIANRL